MAHLGALQIHQIFTNLKKYADQIYDLEWNGSSVVMPINKQLERDFLENVHVDTGAHLQEHQTEGIIPNFEGVRLEMRLEPPNFIFHRRGVEVAC